MTEAEYTTVEGTPEPSYAPTGHTYMDRGPAKALKKILNHALRRKLSHRVGKAVKSRLQTRAKRRYSS